MGKWNYYGSDPFVFAVLNLRITYQELVVIHIIIPSDYYLKELVIILKLILRKKGAQLHASWYFV